MWFRTEPSFDQHVFDRLTRNLVTKPPQRLEDLVVAPTGLFSDSNDCVTNTFLHARSTRLGAITVEEVGAKLRSHRMELKKAAVTGF